MRSAIRTARVPFPRTRRLLAAAWRLSQPLALAVTLGITVLFFSERWDGPPAGGSTSSSNVEISRSGDTQVTSVNGPIGQQ